MDKANKVKPSKSQVSQLSEKVEMTEGPLAPKRNRNQSQLTNAQTALAQTKIHLSLKKIMMETL
jgi:hypothetical protein